MKIKVLKSKKTDFPSYWTPVHIVVKGEEEKGAQSKGLNVYFSKSADKKLPVDFKGGILECKGEDVNVPFVYEIKTDLDTFDRLETQIRDYFKAFNHVCVVTSEHQFSHACELLKNTNVGNNQSINTGIFDVA